MNPPVRRYEVGVSVEALAGAWARRDAAPHGAVVVIDREISGRTRRGEAWRADPGSALSLGVVVRPRLDAEREDLLWCALLVGVTEGIEQQGGAARPSWPDVLVTAAPSQHAQPAQPGKCGASGFPGDPNPPRLGGDAMAAALNVVAHVPFLRVESAALVIRVDCEQAGLEPGAKEPASAAISAAVVRYVDRLADDPGGVLHAWAERCRLVGASVRVRRSPRGESRGRVVGLDHRGSLVLASPAGTLAHVPVHATASIETV